MCSISLNGIGDEGAAAIAAGLRHVSSLTSLEYVHVEDRVWGVRQAVYCIVGLGVDVYRMQSCTCRV